MSAEPTSDPGFAPHDIADSRAAFDWRSKWDDGAVRKMRSEAAFLLLLILFGAVVLVTRFYPLCPADTALPIRDFAIIAWASGLIGGTSFAIKWFYHVAAKGLWHMDRRYWRLFSPIISSILALFANLIIYRDTLTEPNHSGLSLALKVTTAGFLAGYFSDNAFAKLAEVAKVLFGVTESHGSKVDRGGG
jgi:hypothetical protein